MFFKRMEMTTLKTVPHVILNYFTHVARLAICLWRRHDNSMTQLENQLGPHEYICVYFAYCKFLRRRKDITIHLIFKV